MTTKPQDLGEPQMLHAMTLVQRFLLSIPAFILLLWPVFRSGGPAETFPVVTVVIYGVLALPLIFLRYFRFRYQITPREILIQSGVMTRQHRSIPLERIQNIEIEQSLLPRMFGTAKVKIETAGSGQAEGVLEYVSLERAREIREVVRRYQQKTPVDTPAAAMPAEEPRELLLALPLERVFLVGMLRFSLLYIAVAFSALQQFNPDPDEIELWLTRGFLKPIAEFAVASPILLTAGVVALAVALSWITGIAVSFNKHFNFTLWLEGTKLHKRSGLLTVTEGTIPLRRVQTLIFRANALMRRLGWYALRLQTMGVEAAQQGHQLAAPIARWDEAVAIGQRIYPFELPDGYHPVSRLTIRRALIRNTFLLAATTGGLAYAVELEALWLLLLLPLMALHAVQRYRNMGYALNDSTLYVRSGVFIHNQWVIPVAKFQVFYTSASWFQRRLGLATVYVDTAGVVGVAQAQIVDLPQDEATALVEALNARFQRHFAPAGRPPVQSADGAGDEAFDGRS